MSALRESQSADIWWQNTDSAGLMDPIHAMHTSDALTYWQTYVNGIYLESEYLRLVNKFLTNPARKERVISVKLTCNFFRIVSKGKLKVYKINRDKHGMILRLGWLRRTRDH